MKQLILRYKDWLFIAFYGLLIGFILLNIMFIFKVGTDMPLHIDILKNMLSRDRFPVPPLYFLTIYLISFCSTNKFFLLKIAGIILTFSFIIKAYLSVQYIKKTWTWGTWLHYVIMFSVLFFFPISIFDKWESYWYLGKFTPNVFHNSTTIFVMPFCIGLFYSATKYIEKFSFRTLGGIVILGIFIILSKPSFLFAFVPIFPLIIFFYDKKFDKKFIYSVLVSLFFLLLIYIENRLIFELDYNSLSSKILIKPFAHWFYISSNKFCDFLTSFLFLILIVIFSFSELKNDKNFIFAIGLLIVSLMIYFIFVEDGERFFHGNFYWQIPMSYFVVNLTLFKYIYNFLEPIFKNRFSLKLWKNYIIAALLFLHVVSAFVYIIRMFVLKTYF